MLASVLPILNFEETILSRPATASTYTLVGVGQKISESSTNSQAKKTFLIILWYALTMAFPLMLLLGLGVLWFARVRLVLNVAVGTHAHSQSSQVIDRRKKDVHVVHRHTHTHTVIVHVVHHPTAVSTSFSFLPYATGTLHSACSSHRSIDCSDPILLLHTRKLYTYSSLFCA